MGFSRAFAAAFLLTGLALGALAWFFQLRAQEHVSDEGQHHLGAISFIPYLAQEGWYTPRGWQLHRRFRTFAVIGAILFLLGGVRLMSS